MIFLCRICSTPKNVPPSKIGIAKYCSRKCQYTVTEDSGAKMPNYKGYSSGYRATHNWIRRCLGEPSNCSECNAKPGEVKRYEWSNISGYYLRSVDDWLSLCAKCHHKVDRAKRKTLGRRIYFERLG